MFMGVTWTNLQLVENELIFIYLFPFFFFFFGKNQPIVPKNISKEVKSEKCNI